MYRPQDNEYEPAEDDEEEDDDELDESGESEEEEEWESAGESEEAEEYESQPPVISMPTPYSAGLIVASLAVGAFLIWVVRFDFALMLVAGLLIAANTALMVAVGYFVDKYLSNFFPSWAAMTVAIVLGLSVGVATITAMHSPKLLHYYDSFSYSSSSDSPEYE